MAREEENKQDDVVAIELPAPAGWIKKFTPKKGSTPQRNDIVFISPTEEEIKSKRQLEHYLKSHPGGPTISEFDWGTGDTPRRSARLSEKSKAAEAPASQSPKKKQKKSSTKKGDNEKSEADAEAEAKAEAIDDKHAAAEETKESAEDSIMDAKDDRDREVVTEGDLPQKPNIEDVEKKTETEVVLEEPSAGETPKDATADNAEAKVEESKDATTVVEDVKIEESKEASTEVPGAKIDESRDACHAGKETPSGKDDNAETGVVDQDNPKEKQAAEQPIENDPVLQEPTAGS